MKVCNQSVHFTDVHTVPRTLAIVCPCYNEQEVLPIFYERLSEIINQLRDYRVEMCFVNDGSSDQTAFILSQLSLADSRVRYLSLSRNFGHQVALTAGLNSVRADVIVCMDCDMQHPPSLIPVLLERYQEGYDIVSTIRKDTKDASRFKRLTSTVFYRMINLLSDTAIPEGAADFNLFSDKAHQALLSLPERHRFVRGMVSWLGFRRTFVEYVAPKRAAGSSKYSLTKMLRLALAATMSFSTVPLTLAIRLGLIVALAGFLYLAYSVGRYFILGDLVPGWASVVGTVLILGGVQLIFIGILGQYLAMVFEEVKRRPLYLVQYDSATQPESVRKNGPTFSATDSAKRIHHEAT